MQVTAPHEYTQGNHVLMPLGEGPHKGLSKCIQAVKIRQTRPAGAVEGWKQTFSWSQNIEHKAVMLGPRSGARHNMFV